MSAQKVMSDFTITGALALTSSGTNAVLGGFTQATIVADGTHIPTFDGSTMSNWSNTAGARNNIKLEKVGNSKFWICSSSMGTLIQQATSGVSTSATFATTTSNIPNPDRGFYGWCGGDLISNFDLASAQGEYTNGLRLVHAAINLSAYRTVDLPSSLLTTMGTNLGSLRSAGLKVDMVFSYDFSAGGNDTTVAWMTRHIQQLGPVLTANADVIPYMRAGFIGAWGEWHSSQSGNSCGYNSGSTTCATADANRLIVRDALLANVPSTTQIGFRYPADLDQWYPSASAPAQVGMHNDCFLAGPSDSGTFSSTAMRTFAKTLTGHGSFGGETCDNAETPVRSTCADILSEGAQYHLAWLNSLYASSLINVWKAAGCYTTVSSMMGYRLQLDRVTHAAATGRGTTVPVQVDLHNVGWARMFVARSLTVTLRNRSTGATITATGGNLSQLVEQASTSTSVTVNVAVPATAATGTYDVLLSAPDAFPAIKGDVRYAVRFANADQSGAGQSWNSSSATMSTGTALQID
jgi:hypothetical protein